MATIEDILENYKQEELKIEKQLNELNDAINDDTKSKSKIINYSYLSSDEAHERNIKLIKDFETVKGNLRSKAIYSPSELQWEKVCMKYKENPSLPVTTWKCHLPVFV